MSERSDTQDRLRALPSVDDLLRSAAVAPLLEAHPRELVVEAIRTVLDRLRDEIRLGRRPGGQPDGGELTAGLLAPWVAAVVAMAVTPSLRRVINALGVVGHTNVGRAVLPEAALAAVRLAGSGYSNIELDLATGERGSRQIHVHDVLCALTSAEDALVVNNNAAAVLLALAATARGGEVLVARGQLVEIGDGFRIPDILRESGAELVEVGTTNRTYLRDFAAACGERTRAILRVHTSNYRIVGFATEPSVEELATLARERGLALIDDVGSGALADLPLFKDEPSIAASLKGGVDVVTFSGDKLLGGPQAGIAVGRAEVVEAMRRHPLARAVRIDKLGIAALDALLRVYLDPEKARREVPTLAMLEQPVEALRERAERLREALAAEAESGSSAEAEGRSGAEAQGDSGTESAAGGAALAAAAEADIVESVARAGAGALPVTDVPSVALAVAPPDGDAGGLAARLRRGEPAVLARVQGDRVLFDLRTVRDAELDDLTVALLRALR